MVIREYFLKVLNVETGAFLENDCKNSALLILNDFQIKAVQFSNQSFNLQAFINSSLPHVNSFIEFMLRIEKMKPRPLSTANWS